MLDNASILPPLREELRIEEVFERPLGERRWRLMDPLRYEFYILGEADICLLSLWSVGSVGGLKRVVKERGIDIEDQHLSGLLDFLYQNELVIGSVNSSMKDKFYRSIRKKSALEILDQIRGLKIPIVAVSPIGSVFFPFLDLMTSRIWGLVWMLITTFGLYFSFRQWDVFLKTAEGFFNLKGMFAFGISLVFVKFFHEIGHAYFAKKYGCRVGRIGVALFYFMPLFYTEIEDVSRLDDRKKKAIISSGGIFTEINFAGLATFFWSVSTPGYFNSIMFLIATSSWVTSILINLNPFARFDGYYILSDLLKIDNLQTRSIKWRNWFFKFIFLGGKIERPEPCDRREVFGFVVFGILVYFYQVFILSTVALIAFWSLGPVYGGVFVLLTVARYLLVPIIVGLKGIWRERQGVSVMRRVFFLVLLSLSLFVFWAPLDRSVALQGVAGPKQVALVNAPEDAQLVFLVDKPMLKAGDTVAMFKSPNLERQIVQASLQLELAVANVEALASGNLQRESRLVLERELEQARSQLEALQLKAVTLHWIAPVDSKLVDVDESTVLGNWVAEKQYIGRLVSLAQSEVTAFVPENEVDRLKSKNTAVFYPEDPSFEKINLQLDAIDPYAIESLEIVELDARFGGSIKTIESDSGASVPAEALHTARFTVAEELLQQTPSRIRGVVVIESEPESLAKKMWENIWRLIMSEMRR